MELSRKSINRQAVRLQTSLLATHQHRSAKLRGYVCNCHQKLFCILCKMERPLLFSCSRQTTYMAAFSVCCLKLDSCPVTLADKLCHSYHCNTLMIIAGSKGTLMSRYCKGVCSRLQTQPGVRTIVCFVEDILSNQHVHARSIAYILSVKCLCPSLKTLLKTLSATHHFLHVFA